MSAATPAGFMRRPSILTAALIAATAAAASCSSSSGKTPPGTLPPGAGYCRDTCAKTCAQDQECDTPNGELCCDFGSWGKVCLDAQQCPRFCADDARCDPTLGQSCVRTDLSIHEKICAPPAAGIHLCASDGDCAGTAGEVCCRIYDEPICLPSANCPRACASSSECQTEQEEICCTAVAAIEPALNVSGLCLNSTYNTCPRICTQSSDCATSFGEICCDGICQTTCDKICTESSDCNQQICCKSALERIPQSARIFSAGPRCTGTPSSTCAQCASLLGRCCPGCTVTTSAGTCDGSRFFFCEDFIGLQDYCTATPGCVWNAPTGTCSGTPSACGTIADGPTCTRQADCFWSGTVSCDGSPTPCGQIAPSACNGQPGCSVSNP
jgi:hypothetical protein